GRDARGRARAPALLGGRRARAAPSARGGGSGLDRAVRRGRPRAGGPPGERMVGAPRSPRAGRARGAAPPARRAPLRPGPVGATWPIRAPHHVLAEGHADRPDAPTSGPGRERTRAPHRRVRGPLASTDPGCACPAPTQFISSAGSG